MAGPIKRTQSGFPKDLIQSTLKLGDKICTIGQNVFAPWSGPDGERRWYAARVLSITADKFRVQWAEGEEELLLEPDFLWLAKEILQPGRIVGLPEKIPKISKISKTSEFSEFYQEYVIVRYRENGRCSVRGKRGIVSLRKFDEMMIEERDLPPPVAHNERANLLKGHCFLTTISRVGHGMSPLVLSDLIKNLGGIEMKSLEEIVKWQLEEGNPRLCFLLADEPLRTKKFMFCLAANIPCVSSQWLVEMRRSKKYVDFENHRLAAGTDGAGGTAAVVSWKKRKILLNNLRLGIFGDAPFHRFWIPVLEVGKGEPVALTSSNSATITADQLDVVMVHQTAPSDLIQICADEVIPLVTEQWLIQTLIHGKKRPFAAYRPATE